MKKTDNPGRLLSLDVFRGITIGLMIVVNNPGSWEYVYAPLRHSAWHGCTPTDLVFPFFMFIVGSAMWYSFKKFSHTLSTGISIKVLRRTLLIFLIGLALNAYAVYSMEWSSLRIMGILQRIALAYGIASFIVLATRARYAGIITGTILLVYWGLLVAFGGDSPFSLEGNFVRHFDIGVLGEGHVPVFAGVKFDQTGLLSTLPSIGNVLIGFLAGRLIDKSGNRMDAFRKLLLWGMAGVALSLLWSLVLPINKPLWTSTFVLFTSGLALIFLGILLWITNIRGAIKWTLPFQVFGMNPLFIYVLSILLAITFRIELIQSAAGEMESVTSWIVGRFYEPLAGPMIGSLLYALSMTTLCWFVGWILFRRRIFIKI
jgi:predicted acyltransferase